MRSTHTYALLEISPAAYDEIREKLVASGSDGQLKIMNLGGWETECLHMHGLALTRGPEVVPFAEDVYDPPGPANWKSDPNCPAGPKTSPQTSGNSEGI